MADWVGFENISPTERLSTESAVLERRAIIVFLVTFFTGIEYQEGGLMRCLLNFLDWNKAIEQ